jgi:hypothetical protein
MQSLLTPPPTTTTKIKRWLEVEKEEATYS